MFRQIIFQSDWWIHIFAGIILWFILYLVEVKLLKRDFKGKIVLAQLLLANLIDIDHIFSASFFEASRCSINNHPLHSYFAFPVYLFGLLTKYRYFFLGIILHLAIDFFGCVF